MFNPNSIKTPIKPIPSHKINTPLFFIPENKFDSYLKNKNSLSDLSKILQDGETIFVLEHAVADEGRWSKIKTQNNEIGFIMQDDPINKKSSIDPLEKTKPFFPVNKDSKFQPNKLSPQINWKTQEIGIVYEDLYNGAYVVRYNLEEVTIVPNNESMIMFMEQARREGTKLILKHLGFKAEDNRIFNALLNNFYLFSSAEEWYFEPHKCSTLQVAVAIPIRYLKANSEFLVNTSGEIKDLGRDIRSGAINPVAALDNQVINNPELFSLEFKNFDEYKSFFESLTTTLEQYSFFYFTKEWVIDPKVFLFLPVEIENIKAFMRETNALLYSNHPNEFDNKVKNPLLISEGAFAFPGNKISWKNSLKIYFNKKTLKVIDIKYYFGTNVFSLNNGLGNYLNKKEITDKTTISYIINFDPKKDAYNFFDSVAKNVSKDFTNVGNEFTNAAADLSGGLSNATGTLEGAVQFAGGAVEGAGALLDTVIQSAKNFSNALGGNPLGIEEDMKKFLVDKHYPKINSITAKPLDLFECTTTNAKILQDFVNIKAPAEIRKIKELNQLYDREKPKLENDFFIKSIIQGDYMTDRNMRILFGMDKMEGLKPEEQIQKYLSVANSVDWAKFLGFAAQCLMLQIPTEVVLQLLEKYKDARKYIEQLFQASICNPFLKSGLKSINSFNIPISLPVIPAYNPTEKLIKELEAAFYQILKDLVVFGIKKALEAAAKACANNPSAFLNSPSTANRDNPFDGVDQNDPAINDLLDDIANAAKTKPSPASDAEKDLARQKIKDMLDDIMACLRLTEMCALYNGLSVPQETYEIIMNLIKRKYPDIAYKFATKQDIFNFFKLLGTKMDLTMCEDFANPASPIFGNNSTNVLCDDGKIERLRKDLLDNRLPPELINSAIDDLKKEEAKALEDILKLLDSNNPFDFSQVPDLACKVLPSGATLAPSMESFGRLLNSLTKTTYDIFDAEASEWYKTTYSTISEKPNILLFNTGSGEVEVVKSPNVDKSMTTSMTDLINGTGSSAQNLQENKMPAYIFKQVLTSSAAPKPNYFNEDIKYISISSSLDGNLQQKLDINILEDKVRNQIQEGEKLLNDFVKRIFTQLSANLVAGTVMGAVEMAKSGEANRDSFLNILKGQQTSAGYQKIINLIKLMDTYLRNNITDSAILREKFSNFYKEIGIDNIQEANGFFAIENGAALYYILCEQFSDETTRTALFNALNAGRPTGNSLFINDVLPDPALTLQQLWLQVESKYKQIKSFYKSAVSLKVNYPDFDIVHKMGITKIVFDNSSSINSFSDSKHYDIQRLEIYKNKKNYIKITEITDLSDDLNEYINSLNIINHDKASIFKAFLQKQSDKFDSGYIIGEEKDNLDKTFEQINKNIYASIKRRILSKENKFLYLKNQTDSTLQESGSGQPFTQYLKLVVPQTTEQKNCNIRPHYLDIDFIKDGILEDKAKNNCVERIVDDRVVGDKPINSNELASIERSSTQTTLLRGTYRLATRVFLHDILLRAIHIFGTYDPQNLKNDPMFVSFMAKMCESEMRGMDNGFFVLLSTFLLDEYKKANPNETIANIEIRKSLLFRSLVEDELRKFVLPKLAKRINVDTNIAIFNSDLLKRLSSTPIVSGSIRDPEIKLYDVYEDTTNNKDIIFVENKAVYLNLNNLKVDIGPRKQRIQKQKIYENTKLKSDQDVLNEFRTQPEYKLLFNYLFNPVQHLNSFFVLNCLATSTRKQVVNSFRSTKRDIMSTCKVIQSNGQKVANNANDAQASSMNPEDLIAGFILQMLIKTPIQILKGIAETTEPNLAITTTVFKLARTFKPDLTSFLIPAVSIPLAVIPIPPTPFGLLPPLNPIVYWLYMGLLAWYDDKPLDELINGAKEMLEKNAMDQVDCSNVKNFDNFYIDKTPIVNGVYNIKKDSGIPSVGVKREETVVTQQTTLNIPQKQIDRAEALNTQIEIKQIKTNKLSGRMGNSIFDAVAATIPPPPAPPQTPSQASQSEAAASKMLEDIKNTNYSYKIEKTVNGVQTTQTIVKKISELMPSKINTIKIRQIIQAQFDMSKQFNGIVIDLSPQLSNYYRDALEAAKAEVKAILDTQFNQ